MSADEVSLGSISPIRLSEHNQPILLGSGTYGTVYARNNQAHKIFKDKKYREYIFFRELANGRLLDDFPGVVKLLHFVRKPKTLIYEMYTSDIREWAIRNRAAAIYDRRVNVVICLVNTVHNLHQCGLIHGDIKLQNILIRNNEDISLCDLGNVCKPDYFNVRYVTEDHRAPDVKPTFLIDIYSIGVVIVYLFTTIMKGKISEMLEGVNDSWKYIAINCLNPVEERWSSDQLLQALNKKFPEKCQINKKYPKFETVEKITAELEHLSWVEEIKWSDFAIDVDVNLLKSVTFYIQDKEILPLMCGNELTIWGLTYCGVFVLNLILRFNIAYRDVMIRVLRHLEQNYQDLNLTPSKLSSIMELLPYLCNDKVVVYSLLTL